MTPAEFLALTRPTQADARGYCAMIEGSDTETFLTLHMRDGKCHAMAYVQLSLITGDERGGTLIRLTFRSTCVIRGEGLQPAIEAIRAKRAAHLYEFDEDRHDPPMPGEPVITSIVFEVPKAK